MAVVEVYLLVILIFIILGALVAVEMKNLLSAVIALGAVGFGISIAFLFLKAEDLAIVQIAVEVILLIILIRATIRRDVITTTGHIKWIAIAGVVVLLAAFFVIGLIALKDLKNFGSPIISFITEAPSNRYLAEGLEETGASNIITSIILDYRAYDTLGEATVLFAAIMGGLAILRGRSRPERKKET